MFAVGSFSPFLTPRSCSCAQILTAMASLKHQQADQHGMRRLKGASYGLAPGCLTWPAAISRYQMQGSTQ